MSSLSSLKHCHGVAGSAKPIQRAARCSFHPSAWHEIHVLCFFHSVSGFSLTVSQAFFQGIESMSTQLFEKNFWWTSELAQYVQIKFLSKGSAHGFIPFFYSIIILKSKNRVNPFHPFHPARSAMFFRGSSLLKKQVAPLLGQPAFLSNRCASCLGVFLNSQYGQSSLSS